MYICNSKFIDVLFVKYLCPSFQIVLIHIKIRKARKKCLKREFMIHKKKKKESLEKMFEKRIIERSIEISIKCKRLG